MVAGLTGTSPRFEDLCREQEPLGRKHHTSLILFNRPAYHRGAVLSFFLVISPLGSVMDAASSLGVAKPIFHMQSKVTLI